MNGFELAGRAMKVGHVTDRTDGQLGGIGGQGGMQQISNFKNLISVSTVKIHYRK